jgi:imidazolonepropionase-like amidohydrolase
MRSIVAGVAVVVIAVPRLAGAQASRGPLASDDFAITGVTVVPMTTDTVIENATVVVRDGRIAAVGPGARAPSGVRHIDGRGRYLVPGLVDMHVHLLADDEIPDSLAHYELGVMVANGITATRFMMGTPEQLELRKQVATGAPEVPQGISRLRRRHSGGGTRGGECRGRCRV